MEYKLRRRMLNRIKKRIDVIFKYERKEGRGVGDLWDKINMVLKVEKEKFAE